MHRLLSASAATALLGLTACDGDEAPAADAATQAPAAMDGTVVDVPAAGMPTGSSVPSAPPETGTATMRGPGTGVPATDAAKAEAGTLGQ